MKCPITISAFLHIAQPSNLCWMAKSVSTGFDPFWELAQDDSNFTCVLKMKVIYWRPNLVTVIIEGLGSKTFRTKISLTVQALIKMAAKRTQMAQPKVEDSQQQMERHLLDLVPPNELVLDWSWLLRFETMVGWAGLESVSSRPKLSVVAGFSSVASIFLSEQSMYIE